MRFWPFSRRPKTTQAHDDLDAALWEADRAIQDSQQLRCRADDVTGRLERTYARNHIAEAVKKTIRGLT